MVLGNKIDQDDGKSRTVSYDLFFPFKYQKIAHLISQEDICEKNKSFEIHHDFGKDCVFSKELILAEIKSLPRVLSV